MIEDYKNNNFKNFNGIISFINSSEDFDFHWSENEIEEITIVKKEIAKNFLSPLLSFYKEKENIKILDAGCGDGVHIEYLSNSTFFTSENIYALDISKKALEITSKRDNKVKLIQASVSELPFKDELFDSVFSYGVIAYSENPYKSFLELLRCTKKNGIIGLWIYPKSKGIGGYLFRFIRNLCRYFGKNFTNLLGNLIVPFLYFLPTNSKINLSNSTWKQCKEIVLVNISPSQLFFPSVEEIKIWFDSNNVEILKIDENNPLTIWGVKK